MDQPAGEASPHVVRPTETVTGVVFCGGKSSRMGVDKGLLVDPRGAAMIERAIGVLAPLSKDVWLACGPVERYPQFGRSLVTDHIADGGPLAGLEACLARASTPWLCVLACDLPRASTQALGRLLEHAQSADLDACWLSTPAGPEPLFAVYSTRCLEPVKAALAAGERRMIAFHTYPVRGRALRLGGLDLGEAGLALNLNTPADWDDFRKGSR